VLILSSIQLGIDRVSPEFQQSLCKYLNTRYSLGAVGGRPNFAHYFLGSLFHPDSRTPSSLLYLDPHFVHHKVSDLKKEYCLKP
jgi:cysteine protease ATG4